MSYTVPRLILEVFEHVNYGGRSNTILEPVRFTRQMRFQDNISSVKVYKGPSFAEAPNYRAMFYEHRDFRGRKLTLGPGFYPNIHDIAYNFPDRISSINFGSDMSQTGPEWGTVPVVVHVFPQANYGGNRVTILRDITFTREVGMQDNIRSIRILKGPNFPPTGCKVIFYEHVDFTGASLPIDVLPRDSVIEVSDLRLLPERFDRKISSVRIEGWTSSTEYTQSVFHDEFDQPGMDPAWEWVDPRGHGQWTESQGYLQMNVDSGVDLWHGGNYDAPRLIQPIQGDFTIEARMPVASQLREHGGLLVWKGPWAFLRLEKTSGAHAFNGDVRFERHFSGGYHLVGRGPGLRNAKHLYLRLERDGNRFRGFASEDGVKWISAGETISGMTGTVMVGLHALAPGNIPPTSTRFDHFTIYRRPSEASLHYGSARRLRWERNRQLEALTALRRIDRTVD